MALQTQVNAMPAVGLPGQEVSVGTAVYTPINYVSNGSLSAGGFAFDISDVVTGTGSPIAQFGKASARGTGKRLLGLVTKNVTGSFNVTADGDENLYPNGCAVAIARQGDFYHLSTGAAKVGDIVECDPSTGEVSYSTKGSSTPNATGWVVMTPATAKDQIIIISNRGASN